MDIDAKIVTSFARGIRKMDYKEIVDSIWNNALGDATYGASRTLNGLSFGALDYLGNKYGVDTQMNDYLSKKPLQDRQYMQQLGDIAQIGGGLLWGGALPLGNLRKPYNSWQIGRAYDRLIKNPYIGSGKDVITKMKNHKGETVLLQRGEAIPGEGGRVITSGKALKRETGTERNFGLNKAIYKHNVTKEQSKRIPSYLKEQPTESNIHGQDVYNFQTPDGDLRLVTSTKDGSKTISSMYLVDR